MNYNELTKYIKYHLTLHHQCYTQQCKATLWEEICALSLRDLGLPTDWKPNFDHKSGRDQKILQTGIKISNKTGVYDSNTSTLKSISGSRLQKHKTLTEKLKFLDENHDDYIFLLSVDPKEWKRKEIKYYFIVIDSNKFQYSNFEWANKIGENGNHTGWKCVMENYEAEIRKSLSDQLWLLNIKSKMFDYIQKIEIQ